MYIIKVRHNYLYKLLEELAYLHPGAAYRIENDTLRTHDEQVVEAAKYIFQFQPGLLVIEHSIPTNKKNSTSPTLSSMFEFA